MEYTPLRNSLADRIDFSILGGVPDESMRNFHLSSLLERMPALSSCEASIILAFDSLVKCLESGGKILICGNGGSASDAEHWAGELLKGFISKRPLTGLARERLGPELADQLQGSLPAIPLTGFTALRSAFANDCDDSYGYAQLVFGLGRPGDILIGISTSGNAGNVIHALVTAQAQGLETIALTGGDGGKISKLADVAIVAPAREVYLVQEQHLPIYHCLSLMLEEKFFNRN